VNPRFLILSSSGPDIGSGHLTRCHALQQEIIDRGHEVQHFTDSNEFDNADVLFKNWTDLPLKTLAEEKDVVIIDSYKTTNLWLANAPLKRTLIVHMDDYGRIPYYVDVVINSNVYFDRLNYSALECDVFGGPDYTIVRKEFRQVNKTSANRGDTVLITFGGGNNEKLLYQTTKWCLSIPFLNVRVIAPFGMLFNHARLVVLPSLTAEKMAEEMNRAAVVISGSGQTLHELACLGRPTIGICLDYDQEPNHKFYNSIGFLQGNLNVNQKNLKIALLDQLHQKLKEDSSQNFPSNLINPNGVENVIAQVIRSFYAIKR